MLLGEAQVLVFDTPFKDIMSFTSEKKHAPRYIDRQDITPFAHLSHELT